MLTHLLLGLSDSQTGEKSRRLTGAGKHMILVRANLADNCVVPGWLENHKTGPNL